MDHKNILNLKESLKRENKTGGRWENQKKTSCKGTEREI